ncbi:hypothetical protein DOTSEDRAFT_136247 [Dothistroma septosporum NZE10]|uniref:ISWI chromatin-remodeling complex ATPase ISW2 n=1 Tax=Dothistroma septosporum (strain NZE10 / CBS 128990) TaxID=675120 RepID=N1PHE3_DOTSN|nr:hypothetical protein DOTSEDRAFT_136247 [Dothistroma septosporum NZE10]
MSYAGPEKKKQKPPAKKSKKLLRSDTGPGRPRKVKAETARNRVREDIAAHTKPRRDAFLLQHEEYFESLLPDNSYLAKLQRARVSTTVPLPESMPYTALTKQPDGVKANMKPYQLDGLSFLVHMHENGMSSILGDEMGLGKTLQTLALFQYLRENDERMGELRPFLVVCPLSVLSSWISEARKWVPGLNVLRFHGPMSERAQIKADCMVQKARFEKGEQPDDRIDIVVTTYDTFRSEDSWFKRSFVWRYCVLDEGHKIKNEKSDVSSSLQGLSAEYRLLLTGTPLQNNLREMWALLHWLFPEVFTLDTADRFQKAFDIGKGNVSRSFMSDARGLLELIMLRRMKSSAGVNLGLPPKEEVLLYVPLTPMQRFWYTRLLTRADSGTLDDLFGDAKEKEAQMLKQEGDDQELKMLERAGDAADKADEADTTYVWAESRAIMQEAVQHEEAEQTTGAWKKLMNLVMQLRKVCSHPYMLKGAAPPEYEIDTHVKEASGKFIVLDKLLDELVLKQGKKVLIFSGFTAMLDLVGEFLALKGVNGYTPPFRYARLDGRTSRAQRNLSIRLFNDKSSNFKVMLLSTRAGGLGINLTSATEAVFLDEDWNPQMTLQAEARAHRIGQTQKVTIYKLCTSGTVEEQMMGRIRKKLYLSAKITESMRNIHSAQATDKKRKLESMADGNDEAPHLDTASLQSLLRRGAQTLARPEINVTEMLSWDWRTTLEKCKDQPLDAIVVDESGEAKVDEQAWLSSIEKVETAVFEGKKHMRAVEQKIAETTDLSRTERRLGKNTTVMIDGFAISKESLNCDMWEAVPTLAGKDPRLAEPVREKKAAIDHQDFCQTCWDGGEIVLCMRCPRSYHRPCLGKDVKSKSFGGSFSCPQHECRDCGAKTSDAGGLIFRCRWCDNGFCEDCLDWDNTNLIGDTLPEFVIIGFGRVDQAYHIDCPHCTMQWKEDSHTRNEMIKAKARYEAQYAAFVGTGDADQATPDTLSEVETPVNATPQPRSASKASAKKGRVKAVPGPQTASGKNQRLTLRDPSSSRLSSVPSDLTSPAPGGAGNKIRLKLNGSSSRLSTVPSEFASPRSAKKQRVT